MCWQIFISLQDIWDRAVNYPLFGMLHEMSSYVFQFVNSLAVPEEVDDENKRIRDIKPVCGVLMIVKRSIERPGEQLLNTHISHLIGKREYLLIMSWNKEFCLYFDKTCCQIQLAFVCFWTVLLVSYLMINKVLVLPKVGKSSKINQCIYRRV